MTSALPPSITIPDSPPPLFREPLTSTSSIHSFKPQKQKKKAVIPSHPRWPTREEHGEIHSAAAEGKKKAIPPPCRRRTVEDDDEENTVFDLLVASTFSGLSSSKVLPCTPDPPHNPLPPHHPPHPLLDRLELELSLKGPSSTKSPQLWTTTYAPQSAREVLGADSRKSAGILKEWLDELTLWEDTSLPNSSRKRKIVTMISKSEKKKRKKKRRGGSSDEDDGWIVPDDEFFDESDSSSSSASASTSTQEPAFFPRGSASRKKLFPILSNLILLCGPNGTGKTSTVHAVANELGWEVFEVYPGLGKRNAKDLERYVGDVAKNHIVHGNSAGSPSKKKALNPFAMFKKKELDENLALSDNRSKGKGKKTQSLILLEEVDILYQEEKDFWPGVINLVQYSKRPVIMTCTDISTIPFDSLALQSIIQLSAPPSLFLPFAPPPASLAVPFLQLVALCEGAQGRATSTEFLSNLYNVDSLTGFENPLISTPLNPTMAGRIPTPDLRRSLNQLQFECQCNRGLLLKLEDESGSSKVVEEQVEENIDGGDLKLRALEDVAIGADALSFADAYVARRPAVQIEVEESIWVPEGSSALLGVTVLPPFLQNSKSEQLALFGREAEFVTSIEEIAGRLMGEEIDMRKTQALIDEKSRQAILIAHELTAALVDPILPNLDIFVDYLPFIRLITAAEIVRASAETPEDEVAGGNRRSTRLTGKKGYVPKLDWSKDEKRLVKESGFPEDVEVYQSVGVDEMAGRGEEA